MNNCISNISYFILRKIREESVIYFFSGLLMAVPINLLSSFLADGESSFNISEVCGALCILLSGFLLLGITPVVRKVRIIKDKKGATKQDSDKDIKIYADLYGNRMFLYLLLFLSTLILGIALLLAGRCCLKC